MTTTRAIHRSYAALSQVYQYLVLRRVVWIGRLYAVDYSPVDSPTSRGIATTTSSAADGVRGEGVDVDAMRQ